MTDKNLELALRIRADIKQAQASLQQLDAALDSTTAAAATFGKSQKTVGTLDTRPSVQNLRQLDGALDNATVGATALGKSQKTVGTLDTRPSVQNLRQLDGALDDATAGAITLEKTQQSVGGGFTAMAASVKAATLTLAAGLGLAEIAQSADAWTGYQNRLRLVTSSQQELATASTDVYAIARQTSQGLDGTAAVYQRFAQNADALNITQQQTAALTETVSKAVAISGGSALSAEAAMVQFGQALASGVLRGEEFNSVSEQAPALLTAIADGLGMTIGQLREMANAGELSADVLVTALGAAAAGVDAQFETRVKTIAQAATELNTAFTRIVGTAGAVTGASGGMATAITGLADVLDTLSANADVLGAALEVAFALAAGKGITALTGLTAAGLKQIATSKATAVAAAQTALAQEGAAIAAQRAAMAELEKSRAAVASAEASAVATAAEARRTAAIAAASTAVSGKASLDARATAAAAAHNAAEARLAAALEARAVASGQVAVATQAVTTATAASTAAAAGAAVATSVLARAFAGAIAVGGRLLAFLGGPVGLVISLALAATAFIDFGDDAESGMDKAATAAESASVRVRNASRQMIKDLKLDDVSKANFDQLGAGIAQLEAQLTAAQKVRDNIQGLQDQDIPIIDGDLPSLADADEKVRVLTSAIEKLKAEQSSQRFEGVRSGNEYLESLQKQHTQLQKLTPTEEALNYLRDNQIAQNSVLGKQILQQAADNQKLAETTTEKTKAEQAATAAVEESRRTEAARTTAQLGYVEQLERTVEVMGLSKEALRDYDLAEQGLTGTLLERAQAAAAAITAQERLNQATADTKELGAVKNRISELEGNPEAARAQALEAQFNELRSRLATRSDQAGIDLINKLINLELAQVRMGQLQDVIDSALSRQSRIEESIRTQQEAGLLTEIAAREKIVELHRQTAAELEKQRPLLAEMAQQPGAVGEAAQVALAALDDEILRLHSTLTVFQSALKEGLQAGLADSIKGLADGTLTLQDAVSNLATTVADSLLRMASDGLAQMLTNNIMSVFTGGAQAAAAAATQATATQVAAITTVTTAQTTADTVRTASAVAAANTAVAGTAPAAAAATAQWTPPAAAASTASFGSAAFIGIAALLAILAMAKANFFASGGHVRGPGTATSDSIPAMLSDFEFVTRASVVKQPGALSFLKDFNSRGMSALDTWAGRTAHATGGLAGTPAPALPSPTMGLTDFAEPAPATAKVDNNFRFLTLFDIDDVGRKLGNSSGFEETLLNLVSSNPGKFREALDR